MRNRDEEEVKFWNGISVGSNPAMGVVMSGGAAPAVAQPDAAFAFLPFSIYDDGDGTFSIGDWDISTQVTRTTVRYVNKSGNDTTGDGLTVGTAWKTLTKAWTVLAAVADACVIVGAGRYGWSDGGFNDTATTAAMTGRSLIASGDVVLDAYLAGGAYALVGGKTNTYQSAQAIPIGHVLDYGSLDANGDPTSYALVADVDAVEATAGTFWWDDPNNILYVHTLENNTPDTDVRPQYTGASSLKIAVANVTAYIEGFKCYCTRFSAITNGTPNTGIVYAKDCRFMFYRASQTIAITGYTAFLESCQYAHSKDDGLIGNVGNTVLAKICEINCEGWDFGVTGNTGINATTNHGAGINVMIGGEYYNTYGPPVGFIQSGAAWILGANIHDDLSTGDYSLLLQEPTWLDTVTISGNTTDISANTTIYVRNCTPATPSVTGGGSVTPY